MGIDAITIICITVLVIAAIHMLHLPHVLKSFVLKSIRHFLKCFN